MQLQTLIQQFEEDIKLCWHHPENDMLLWAQEYEQHGNLHGLGDLTKPCEPRAGETCPACGRQWL